MGSDLSKDMQLASAACEEELKPLVYHKSSEVIAILINNKNLTEDLAVIIAGRKILTPEYLNPYHTMSDGETATKLNLHSAKTPRLRKR